MPDYSGFATSDQAAALLAGVYTPTAITPSGTTDTTAATACGLYVITSGNLSVKDAAGNTLPTYAVSAGTRIPWVCSRVLAATTAVVVGLSL